VVEGENVPDHVKGGGIVREGECPAGTCMGKCPRGMSCTHNISRRRFYDNRGLLHVIFCHTAYCITSSPAVAERPRDASYQ